MDPLDAPASAEALRERIVRHHAVRLHCTLILVACFAAGLAATKLLLMAGVSAMWIRYALALVLAYGMFLLGVRLWLRYAGFDVPVLPRKRSEGGIDLPDVIGNGGSSRSAADVFRAGGGRSGGGGASFKFDGGPAAASEAKAASIFSNSSSGGGGGGGVGFDLDDGMVLVALLLLVLAVSGALIYLVWAAPTILADAAFAALLSAGLVKSTRRMASGHWVTSVIGHTWIPFAVVAVMAIGFALVAQHHYPEARTLPDVLRRLSA